MPELKAGKDGMADAIKRDPMPSLAALVSEVGLGISQAAAIRRQLGNQMKALAEVLEEEIALQSQQAAAQGSITQPKGPS